MNYEYIIINICHQKYFIFTNRYYYDKNIMTKVHGKRYAYKFDFGGLAQAMQPSNHAPEAQIPYKYPPSSDLFLAPPSYGHHHHHNAAKLNIMTAHAQLQTTTSGLFASASPYWSGSSTAGNLYSAIGTVTSHPSHFGSYYVWTDPAFPSARTHVLDFRKFREMEDDSFRRFKQNKTKQKKEREG